MLKLFIVITGAGDIGAGLLYRFAQGVGCRADRCYAWQK